MENFELRPEVHRPLRIGVRPPNPHFTGRESILASLETAFAPSEYGRSVQRRFVLCGLGGIGKTEICRHHVHAFRDSYWGIFWIDASSHDSILQSVNRITMALGMEQSVEAVRQELADTERHWLLVFDNVEGPNISLSEYFPAGVRGDIIITGRYYGLQQYSTVGHEEIGFMDRDEAKALLFSLAYGQDSIIGEDMADGVGDVVDYLDCHPLAIFHAARLMRSKSLSPKEYVEYLAGSRKTNSEGYQTRSEADTAKDSGYVSDPTAASSRGDGSASTLPSTVEIDEGNDMQSVRSLSTLVNLGEYNRTRSISMFALNIVDSVSPDIYDAIHNREEALFIIQEALEAFSYSVEREDQFPAWSPERQASTFVRQQTARIAKRVANGLDYAPSSPDENEREREHGPGLLSESGGIHDWMQNTSFDVVLANPDEGGDDDLEADNSKEDQGDNLTKMIGYLTDSTPFAWMTQRIQAFVSKSRGKSLHLVFVKLLRGLRWVPREIRSPTMRLSVHCNLVAYPEANFDSHVSLASLICVNVNEGVHEASALGEYMARMWPTTGTRFLEILQEWIDLAITGRNDSPFKRVVGNGEVTFISDDSYLCLDITGPVFLMIEVGEQLAWLGCVCRTGKSPDKLTLVRPIISLVDFANQFGKPEHPTTFSDRPGSCIAFNITFQSEEHTEEHYMIDGMCWRKLFRGICVADGFPVSTRRGRERGLELPFDMMAQLGGAHRATYWDGRLVLKGFETLFVPVEKTGACISWHLVTKANCRRVSYNAAGDLSGYRRVLYNSAKRIGQGCEQQVYVGDLLNCRHFLGWVGSASQHAGTEDGNYDQSSDVYLDPPGRGFVLSGVSITISKILGMGATLTRGPAQRGIRTSDPTQFFSEVVDKMTKMHVLLYDHKCARGWLLDGASALLHILRFHVASYTPIKDCGTFDLSQFCYADSRIGSDAAKKVLLNPKAQDMVLLMERLRHEKEAVEQSDGDLAFKTLIETDVKKCLLKDRILDMWDVLEQMYDRWKGKKESTGIALMGIGAKLEGWKFQDVVDREHSIDPVVAELDDSATDWLHLIRRIDAVVLFGNNFGELMRPMGEHCTNWTSVPREKFCLAVTIPQLRRIAKKHGRPDETPIKLAEGVYWHLVEHPFECNCGTRGTTKKRPCGRIQALQPLSWQSSKSVMGGEVLSAADNDNGAVIFCGRKMHKSLGGREASMGDERLGTGVMRKLRQFLKKRL